MRSPSTVRHVLATAALAAAVVLAPAAAHAVSPQGAASAAGAATPPGAATAAPTDACTVTDATLTWGFKESFRSYISGTIARGQWEPSGGATYTTPAFSWSTATGSTATGTVSVSGAPAEAALTGGIRFTGHDGLLDTTIANPTLVLDTPTHATLRLDVSGVSMEAALAGDETATTVTQVPFVDIDLSGATVGESADGMTITATDAPTAITADGFAAFGNYETGTAFDPITIAVTAVCAADAAASRPADPATPIAAAAAPEKEAGDTTATAWRVGAGVIAALAVVGVGAGFLVRRRKTKLADAADADPDAQA